MTTLAQITDIHIDNQVKDLAHIDPRSNFLRALDAVQKQGIQQVVFSGDIAETPAGVDWFFEQVHLRGLQYHLILGNHDLREPFLEKKELSHPAYYATSLDGFHVLFMDSAVNQVDDEQLGWLASQIEVAEQNLIIFIHHPVLDCGGSFMDKKYPLRNRDDVLAVLNKSPRPVTLFCGHYHTDEVVGYANITQHVTPSSFYQLKKYTPTPETAHEKIGYRILTIENGQYRTEVQYLTPEHLETR